MPDCINPTLILAHANAWVGTPFSRRAALRGAGADCIGLVRGIYRELTGQNIEPPAWNGDWYDGPTNPIFDGLYSHAQPVALDGVKPGHIITYRVGHKRAAHVAILTAEGAIHAWEVGGVKETLPLFGREITSAWGLPCADGYESGPAELDINDCMAVIYRDGKGYHAEISELLTGAPLALTQSYASQAAALAALDPIYPNIECVE
ncbi:MAG: hypothetical protein ABJL72_12160 [Roseobacter sp.]